MTNDGRHRWPDGLSADLALVGLVALCGLLLAQPGVFSVDESHYLLAADAAWDSQPFRIENGYRQLRHPALLYFYTVVPDGVDELGTVATVPPYQAWLAAPFLALGGAAGMIWLNLLAFAATLLAVRRLALRLGLSPRQALAAAAAFALGGMGLEYALGIWPHALSQALVGWLLLLVMGRADDRGAGPAAWLAAGLLGGIATGVRLQNIVWLPVLGVLAGWRPPRPARLLAWLAGWSVPLAGLALVNWWRLGTANPFTYGRAGAVAALPLVRRLLDYWPLAAGVVLATGLLAVVLWRARSRLSRPLTVGAVLAPLVLVLLIPASREWVFDWLRRVAFFLIDPALGRASLHSAGGHPGAWGQVYYGGVLKKGLLEVLPLAGVAIMAPLLSGRVRQNQVAWRLWLGSLGALSLLPFILSAGGWCYNPRYLLELLPGLFLLAVLVAVEKLPPRLLLLAGILVGLALALPVVLQPGDVSRPAPGRYQLVVGLLLAVAAVVAALPVFGSRLLPAGSGKIAGCLLAAACAYGTCLQLGSDLRASHTVRYYAARMAAAGGRVLPEHSLLLAWEARKDVFTPLKLDRDLWLGGLRFDDDRDDFPFEKVPPQRRAFVLANGIPRQRLERLLAGRRTRVERVQGLVFVELEP